MFSRYCITEALLHFSGSVMAGVDPQIRRLIGWNGGWGYALQVWDSLNRNLKPPGNET